MNWRPYGEYTMPENVSAAIEVILEFRIRVAKEYHDLLKRHLGDMLVKSLLDVLQVTPESLLWVPQEKLHSKIISLVHPEVNVYHHKKEFQNRRQYTGESLHDFWQALTKLSKSCDFGHCVEDRIREQFILGIKNESQQTTAALHKTKTIDEVIRILEGGHQNQTLTPFRSSSMGGVCLKQLFAPNAGGQRNVDSNRKLGIEGWNNSCYLDTSLMACFMFETSFQDWGTKSFLWNSRNTVVTEVCRELRERQCIELKTGIMNRFREAMRDINPEFMYKQMDAEQFIGSLFGQLLSSRPFYKIEGNGAFTLQLVGRMDSVSKILTVQQLLENTFSIQGMKLDNVPSPGFILKLPFSDGKPITERIFPDPRITLNNTICYGGCGSVLALSAVICLENNHNTVFLRTGSTSSADWLYLDSFRFGGVARIPYFAVHLHNWHLGISPENPNVARFLENLSRHAYMCFYIPEDAVR